MDPIEKAIAAAGEAPAEAHRKVTVTIASTGRHIVLSFPLDMTDSEALEFVGWVGSSLRQALSDERAKRAGPQILVPAGMVRN